MEQNITGMSAHHRILAGAIKHHRDQYFQLIAGDHTNNSDEIDELRTTLNILIFTYIEALINIYLSIKLSEENFLEVERFGIMKKWEEQPKLLNPEYSLDDDLKCCLESLKDRRDRIVHFKPEIVVNGKTKTKGKPVLIPWNEHENILAWVQLPEKLVRNIGKYDQSNVFFQYFHNSHVAFLRQN